MYLEGPSLDSVSRLRSTFQLMSISMNPVFVAEGAPLNFEGLSLILKGYFSADMSNIEELWQLNKELIAWIDYIVSVQNLSESLTKKASNRVAYLSAFKTARENKKLEQELAISKTKTQDLKNYTNELKRQKNCLLKMQKHIDYEFSRAVKSYSMFSQ